MSRVPGLLLAALLLLPGLVAAKYSKLWGKHGELWSPAGRLPDFSFAGYKQSNEPLPLPPVTRSVLMFRKPGMSDTGMLQAALAWAHLQPVTDRHIVLMIPRGRYNLTERLWIRRSKLVLRGAGARKTKFYIPQSLRGIYGPNPENQRGAYVNTDGFVTIKGSDLRGRKLARVSKSARQGDVWLQVDDARQIQAGRYYDLWWTDVAGKFNDHMFDDLWKAPARYDGDTRVKFTTKVLAVRGNRIRIERFLPYDIHSKLVVVAFYAQPATVTDSGVEGVTFRFKWSLYAGHHLEDGWNAVEVSNARDCWVRDIASVNADSTVLINGASSITVQGVRISATRTRGNDIPNAYHERADTDGHWGVQHTHSFDVLSREIVTTCALLHDVGTGSSGKFGVFMNIRMRDGNLDLHRALAGPTLYTNIDVGKGSNALLSGGPPASGPNALGGTTWWNIVSDMAVKPNDSDKRPGDCSYGPSINLVNVNIMRGKARTMCRTWWYERSVSTPKNLYEAQYRLRRARQQAQH